MDNDEKQKFVEVIDKVEEAQKLIGGGTGIKETFQKVLGIDGFDPAPVIATIAAGKNEIWVEQFQAMPKKVSALIFDAILMAGMLGWLEGQKHAHNLRDAYDRYNPDTKTAGSEG